MAKRYFVGIDTNLEDIQNIIEKLNSNTQQQVISDDNRFKDAFI